MSRAVLNRSVWTYSDTTPPCGRHVSHIVSESELLIINGFVMYETR